MGSSIYAKYYFDLRQLAKEQKMSFPDELLTKEKAIKLEALSSITYPSPQTTHSTESSTVYPVHGNQLTLMPNTSLRRSASVEFTQSPRRSLLIIS